MEEDERDELLRRIFYALTCHAEDIAGSATDGQGSGASSTAGHRAQTIRTAAEHILVLAEAANALAPGSPPGDN